MIFRSRSRLLLGVSALALTAVMLPAGIASASAASVHTETTPTKEPWVSRIYQNIGPTTGGIRVLFYGHHLAGVTEVRFGGVPATNVVISSDDELAVTAPAHATGVVGLRVDAPAGSIRPSVFYRYVVPPTITNLSPALAATIGGTSVTVTGTGFSNPQSPVASVKFDGVKGTDLVVQNDTTLTVTAPVHVAANVRVRVVEHAASSIRSTAGHLVYDVAPTISSKSPYHGPPTGGTSVTITGTGFTGATSVTFDGLPASFTVNSDTQIVAVTPPHATGWVAVTITTPHGPVTDPADTYPWVYD